MALVAEKTLDEKILEAYHDLVEARTLGDELAVATRELALNAMLDQRLLGQDQ